MNIHDATLERAEKIALQHAHETGKHHQIHLRVLQRGHERAFGIILELGAEFSRRDELRGQFPLACVRQDPRRLDIAQDDGNFRGNFPRGHCVRNGDKIGAFAGTQDADAKCAVHSNLNNRVFAQTKDEMKLLHRRKMTIRFI